MHLGMRMADAGPEPEVLQHLHAKTICTGLSDPFPSLRLARIRSRPGGRRRDVGLQRGDHWGAANWQVHRWLPELRLPLLGSFAHRAVLCRTVPGRDFNNDESAPAWVGIDSDPLWLPLLQEPNEP